MHDKCMELLNKAEKLKEQATIKIEEASTDFDKWRDGCENIVFGEMYVGCSLTDYFCQMSSWPLLGKHGRYIPSQN